MRLIGKGSFTKAYLRDDERVQLHSVCPIKECMSLGWFPDSRLFPRIERIDDNTYEMDYFPRVKSLKKTLNTRDYTLYKLLCAIFQKRVRGITLHAAFDTLPLIEYHTEIQALHDALDACFNYGEDIVFEISPRNVAVCNGSLILLDCFFQDSALKRVRSKSI